MILEHEECQNMLFFYVLEHIIVHTVKKSPSNGGNAAHSGSVVMQVLAISSVTTEHLTIHKRN